MYLIPAYLSQERGSGLEYSSFYAIFSKKLWEVNMGDTLLYWKFGDFKNYTSLSLLTAILGFPTTKDDFDRSMVRQVFYKENKYLSRFVEYCQKDVVAVANVILRFRNLPLLKPENILVAG